MILKYTPTRAPITQTKGMLIPFPLNEIVDGKIEPKLDADGQRVFKTLLVPHNAIVADDQRNSVVTIKDDWIRKARKRGLL